MPQSIIKDNRRIFSVAGGDPSLSTRVTNLENNEYKITYFESVSATSGTVTKPTNSTILTDQFQGGIDAYVSTIVNGQPTGILPQTAGGVNVDVTSFNSSGDWVLNGTPSAYPVAIIYVIKIKAIDYVNLTVDNILDVEESRVGINEVAYGTTSGVASSPGFTASIANNLTLIGARMPNGPTTNYVMLQSQPNDCYVLGRTNGIGEFYILAQNTHLALVSQVAGKNIAFRTQTNTTRLTVNDTNNAIEVGANTQLKTAASVTARASLNIPSGTAPTSPVVGDFWHESGYVYMRVTTGFRVQASATVDAIYAFNLLQLNNGVYSSGITARTGGGNYGNYFGNGQYEIWSNGGSGIIVGSTTAKPVGLATNNLVRFEINSTGDIAMFGTPSLGSGVKVMFIGDCTTAPSTDPTGGGILYVEAGALKYRGSSGTVTTLGNA